MTETQGLPAIPETAHDHSEANGAHDHSRGMGESQLRMAFLMTVGILGIEAVAGVVSHSVALLADAGHILTDVVALGFAWFAVIQARRPADRDRTFGYKRVGILAAMFNGAMLLAVVLGVGYEAIVRLQHPEPIQGGLVIVAALVAIAVNLFIAFRLSGAGKNLNIRAAMLHVVGDLAASVGVVLAGIVVLTTHWSPADPILSLGIALLISWSAVRLLRDASAILLEGAPEGLDLDEIRAEIVRTPNLSSVHDLHVWSLGSEELVLSCHVVVTESSMDVTEHLIRDVEARVCDRFGIRHITIQAESCCPCAEDCESGGSLHNHPHAYDELSGLTHQH
ncbi:MAG: cation diffusion facilitator family transporter [Candidatus Dormibacteria bacterium]